MTAAGRVIISFWLAATLALLAAPGEARTRTVQAPPMRKGDCHWVHGRFAVYNGSMVQRIWIIGTKRLVAMSDVETHVPWLIRAYEYGSSHSINGPLFADFRICAMEDNRPGYMQLIRIIAVQNPVVDDKPFRPRYRPNPWQSVY
jgi:hypothetical protein